VLGTSVGALTAGWFAANAHRPAADAVPEAVAIWSEMRFRDILAPLVSLRGLARLANPRSTAFLDPTPLRATLGRFVAFDALAANVASGTIRSAAVAATSPSSGRTVVFQAGGDPPPRDDRRGIDYVATRLGPEHLLASAAIPALFPAVHVSEPAVARGWYFDGGTRLNTPIKPALEFGADRVVVIGLNSIAPGPRELASERRPDVYDGVGTLLQALFADPLAEDVDALAAANEEGRGRRIPYVFVAPRRREAMAEIAARAWRDHYRGVAGFRRDRDLALVGTAIGAAHGGQRAELLSLLFFAPPFARELIALGAADARAWLAAEHDDGPWRLGRPPDRVAVT
jgi:NTE family protein